MNAAWVICPLAIVAGLLAGTLAAAPASAASPPEGGSAPAASLRIEVAEKLVQGTESQVVVVVHDSAAQPVSGAVVRLSERVVFFGYEDVMPVGEARTDYRGRATLDYVPPLEGASELTAEFDGNDRFAPAVESVRVVIEPGVRVGGSGGPGAAPAILPRGVTDIWFLVLLVGVWAAIGAVVYNVVRIPSERGRPAASADSGHRPLPNELLPSTVSGVSKAWRAPPSEP